MALRSPQIIKQLLDRAKRFSSCCFLDDQHYASALHEQDLLLGAGVVASITFAPGDDLRRIDEWLTKHRGAWIFGHISYDLKQHLHGPYSSRPDPIGFSLMHFFVPEICVALSGGKAEITSYAPSTDPAAFWELVGSTRPDPSGDGPTGADIRARMDHATYMHTIKQLQGHILRGDCYEINFCQEFFAEGVRLSPVDTYHALVKASPNPFSCYYRQGHAHLMCASPERFLAKRGSKIYSQPIKGTAARHLSDPEADVAARDALLHSPKERSENVMVVDLVRNDLSQVCAAGTVQVDELYGLYTYPQVHQMISTISGTLLPHVRFSDILTATFPMGSMTGAPKHRVMQLIDEYEPSRRGLFSGSVGYFSPEGDLDLNVVIRSILYNDATNYLSYQVGSGITWYADAEQEFEECKLKAQAIREVLGAGS
ncbi:MAG TPA: anthranilate synthase component I family protein [Phnomibacter sp.]|nr:anthranilate synthase component I family protein [Phnomibacter sp.]